MLIKQMKVHWPLLSICFSENTISSESTLKVQDGNERLMFFVHQKSSILFLSVSSWCSSIALAKKSIKKRLKKIKSLAFVFRLSTSTSCRNWWAIRRWASWAFFLNMLQTRISIALEVIEVRKVLNPTDQVRYTTLSSYCQLVLVVRKVLQSAAVGHSTKQTSIGDVAPFTREILTKIIVQEWMQVEKYCNCI